MSTKFFAKQKTLYLSDCERLCAAGSREVGQLASSGGWGGMPWERLEVPVGIAINMLVLSIGASHGVELGSMGSWLPGLRSETLLKLGENISNWAFEGTSSAEQDFLPMLYGDRDTVRPRIAPLLGVSSGVTTRQIRYFSQSDVERLSPAQFEQGQTSRTPLFSIDAHALASQVQSVCGSPLFTANVAPAG